MPDPKSPGALKDFSVDDVSAQLLAKAATSKGLTLSMITKEFYVIEGNGRAEYFEWTMPASTSHLAKMACKIKPLAKRFFRQSGVSTPRGLAFTPREVRQAVEFMRTAGCKKFVLKPADGALGEMVFMNIDSEEKLREKIAQFRKRKPLLLEEQAEGIECRYFVIGDRVVAVAERKPPEVVGDGRSTIYGLIESKNAGRKGHLALMMIEANGETREVLAAQGLTLDAVPEEGRSIRLKGVSNIAQGGENVDMTDVVHEDLKALAVAAFKAIPSLRYAGVDIIAEDHAAPLSGQRAVVLEINSSPGFKNHHAPAVGQPRDVAGAIIDHLFFR